MIYGRSLMAIKAVIVKATQGLTFHDPEYAATMAAAAVNNLLQGSYHFGSLADGMAQADFFLKTRLDAHAPGLMVLDFEINKTAGTMTLDQARDFVRRIKSVTGVWPVLYAGGYLKMTLNGAPDETLSQCPLWLAQYGPSPILPPGWDAWALWQYTDKGEVDGIGGTVDRSRFNGTDAMSMIEWWNAQSF
jgi:lysozyme